MAIKKFNAAAGFSVGDDVVFEVIDNVANVNANNLTSNGTVNFTNSANVDLGNVANIHISGGDSGYVLKTDGLGNLSWDLSTTAGGPNTTIQFNNDGTLSGTTDLTYDYATQVLTLNGNLTTTNANLGNLVTANYFSGNGSLLSSITAANINGTVANANYAAYAGNVVNADQANITSLGTLASLTVSGNVSSGNANLGNLGYANYLGGTLTTASQPNITSTGTLSNLTSNGTVDFTNASNVSLGNIDNLHILGGSDGYVLKTDGAGNLSWGLDTAPAGGSNTQVQFNDNNSLGASANFTFDKSTDTLSVTNITANGAGITYITGANINGQVGNALIAGTVYTNAQPNITSVGTLTSLSITGNVTSGNANLGNLTTANYFSGNGSLLTSLTGANVTGTVANANYAAYSGNVINATQSNITAVGTLSNLTSNGTVDFTNATNVSLGIVSNLHISGGTSGQFLTTDGSGGISWSAVGQSGSLANGTSNIDIPIANGNINFAVNGNDDILVVTNTGIVVDGNVQVTGNATVANISADYITGTLTPGAQPNILSVGTLTSLSVTGNVTTSNYFLGNGYYLTGIAQATSAAAVANGTTIVNVPVTDGPVTFQVSGNSNVLVVTGTGANITGSLNVTGNTSLGNLSVANLDITNGNIAITGNVSSGNANLGNLATANYFSGNGYLLTSINASNITGTVANANYAAYAGNVINAAQANITSLGTLSGLTVNGVTNLGSVSNVKISGGSLGYVISTDGSGNLSFSAPSLSGGFVNIIKDTFTGNGVQTTFVLSTIPSGIDAISVVVSGLVQQETTYSLSSNEVTFASAPLNGAFIEISVYGVIPPVSNTQVPYSNGSYYVGSSAFTFNSGTNTLSVTNLTSSGNVNFSSTSNVSLGTVGNIHISGGSSGQYLMTDGSGTLSWTTVSIGSSLSNGTSNVSIPTVNGNVTIGVGGTSNVAVISTTGVNIAGNLTVSNVIESTTGTLKLEASSIDVESGNAGIFTTGISNINFGLVANITMGSTTGTQTIRGNIIANGNVSITNLKVNDFYSNRSPINVTANTVVDEFSVFTYRSAKYTMRVNSDDGFQAVEVLLIHDNSNSFVTIYGSLSTIGSDIISLSSDINSGNVRLLVSTSSANTSVNLLGTYVTG